MPVVPVKVHGAMLPVDRQYAADLTSAERENLHSALTDFRAFLNWWRFESTEENTALTLGTSMWPAQEQFAATVASTPNVYALKARRMGQSTIAAAYCGFVQRRAPANTRVHVFSRGESEAKDLLRSVVYGLDHLPTYMRLPVTRRAAQVYELEGSRICRAYAAAGTSGIDQGAEFVLLDEWARMPDPTDLWQRVEPTALSSLILTVGVGPQGAAADYWRACENGAGKHVPIFIAADARPGRDRVQMEIKRRELSAVAFRREYAMTADDALSGGGTLVFNPEEIEAATQSAPPLRHRGVPGKKYVTGWDLGSRQDATVGITLEVSAAPYLDVAGYQYIRGADHNQILRAIRDTHFRYDGGAGQHFTVLEENGIGAVLLDATDLPRLHGFTTTKASKDRIIEGVQMHLQRLLLSIPAECAELLSELRGYTIPDTAIRQDAVMALAIAIDNANLPFTHRPGRVMGVYLQNEKTGAVEPLPHAKKQPATP